jgi:ABC-type transport system involved in cytochrome bd biosynthesis fused ATPase/permease subunit
MNKEELIKEIENLLKKYINDKGYIYSESLYKNIYLYTEDEQLKNIILDIKINHTHIHKLGV